MQKDRREGMTEQQRPPRKPSKNFRGPGYPCGLSLHVRKCGHGRLQESAAFGACLSGGRVRCGQHIFRYGSPRVYAYIRLHSPAGSHCEGVAAIVNFICIDGVERPPVAVCSGKCRPVSSVCPGISDICRSDNLFVKGEVPVVGKFHIYSEIFSRGSAVPGCQHPFSRQSLVYGKRGILFRTSCKCHCGCRNEHSKSNHFFHLHGLF